MDDRKLFGAMAVSLWPKRPHALVRLVSEGYVWIPRRGLYLLTARGRRIAAELEALIPEAQPEAASDAPNEGRYKAFAWMRRRRP